MFKVLNHSDNKLHSTQTPPPSAHSLYDGWWLGHEQQTLHRVGILSLSHVLGHTPSMRGGRLPSERYFSWSDNLISYILSTYTCAKRRSLFACESMAIFTFHCMHSFEGGTGILFNTHHLSVATRQSRSQTKHVMGTRLILIYRPHKLGNQEAIGYE